MRYQEKRKLAAQYAWHYLGTFYSWGGDDPSSFDCSGICVEIGKAIGFLHRKGDWNSKQLSRMWPKVETPYKGCLACYDTVGNGDVTHIEFCYDNDYAIGASGGGRRTKTREDAIRDNAFIKLRPILRPGLLWVVDPFSGDLI